MEAEILFNVFLLLHFPLYDRIIGAGCEKKFEIFFSDYFPNNIMMSFMYSEQFCILVNEVLLLFNKEGEPKTVISKLATCQFISPLYAILVLSIGDIIVHYFLVGFDDTDL